LSTAWIPLETNTHQDHVIAHVLGATLLAYLVLDEVLYLLLDIGFIWNVFVDGEMGLLPHPVAVNELDVDNRTKDQIKTDVDAVLNGRTDQLAQLRRPPVICLISEVSLLADENRRLLVITGEPGGLEVEMELQTGAIEISAK
jgi:hypothetical protein